MPRDTIKQDTQENNHVNLCNMDVAGAKHARFGLFEVLIVYTGLT